MIPSFEEIEATINSAAQMRIESAYREVEDTRARIERERTARERALQASRDQASQTKAALERLGDERTAMEQRARAFLAGGELKNLLENIHLAFNARQLELETALAAAEADTAEAQTDAQASGLTEALELQLLQQELERLESAAPDVAETVRLVATAAEKLGAAMQAVQDGMLQDAAVLLEQAKAGHAEAAQVANVEQALAEAERAKLARDLIARINTRPEQPGGVRRIHELIEEARQAGVDELVTPFAERRLEVARAAANARFAQARPIADHLASEGYVPVVGDGRIEAWKQVVRGSRTANDQARMVWSLDRILTLRGDDGWVTEMPRNPVTQKELPDRVRHSRWYRVVGDSPAG